MTLWKLRPSTRPKYNRFSAAASRMESFGNLLAILRLSVHRPERELAGFGIDFDGMKGEHFVSFLVAGYDNRFVQHPRRRPRSDGFPASEFFHDCNQVSEPHGLVVLACEIRHKTSHPISGVLITCDLTRSLYSSRTCEAVKET